MENDYDRDNVCRHCGCFYNPPTYCKGCAERILKDAYGAMAFSDGLTLDDIEMILNKLYPDG